MRLFLLILSALLTRASTYKIKGKLLFFIFVHEKSNINCPGQYKCLKIISATRINSTKCESFGEKMASSLEECKAAAKSIGLPFDYSFDYQAEYYPHGCLYVHDESSAYLQWVSPEDNLFENEACGSKLEGYDDYKIDCICVTQIDRGINDMCIH